jgi:hypothetical protein
MNHVLSFANWATVGCVRPVAVATIRSRSGICRFNLVGGTSCAVSIETLDGFVLGESPASSRAVEIVELSGW